MKILHPQFLRFTPLPISEKRNHVVFLIAKGDGELQNELCEITYKKEITWDSGQADLVLSAHENGMVDARLVPKVPR